jgi:predicted GNAT family acetyltransferase
MLRELTRRDRQAILDFAYEREKENIFIIGSFDRPHPFDDNRYFGWEEGGKLHGIAVFFGQWGSFVANAEETSIVDTLVDAAVAEDIALQAVPAFLRCAEPILARLAAHGITPVREEQSLVFELPRQSFHPVLSQAHLAAESDREAIVHLDHILHGGNQPAVPSSEELRRLVPVYTFVLEEGGQLVSKANLHGLTQHYAQIGGVVTHPDFRERGYASQCVSALCNHFFSQGTETMLLFTAEKNLPAQRLYMRLGFHQTEQYLLAEFNR